MITSTKNQQVRWIIELNKKAKTRNEAGLFAVEGIRMAKELPLERTEQVYVSESFLKDPENRKLLDRFSSYEETSDLVFAAMSDTKTPQGILALVRKREYTLDELLSDQRPPFLMVLENLQDPGNLGTIVRTGEAAGVTGILMSRETVDIYNPKVIRSTMGSVFRVPFLYADDLFEALRELQKKGVRFYAAHLEGASVYDEEDYQAPCGFLIGNEGSGLSREITAFADARIRIPMEGEVESLNAAVAASVLLFETARQRRGGILGKEAGKGPAGSKIKAE